MSFSYHWSRLVLGISVIALVHKLYDAWAIKAGIESWFLTVSEYNDLRNKNVRLQGVVNS